MTPRITASLLLAGLASLPLAMVTAAPAYAQQVVRPAQSIVLSIGRGELVTVPGAMADVFVANDEVADVQVKSRNELYVFAKAGGETTVYASNAAGQVVWAANVRVGSNIDSIDQMLALAMPEAQIAVSTMGTNTVLLTGTVAAPEDAAEAERLVKAFVGENSNVISRLRMATPLQVNLQVRFAEVSRSLVRAIGVNLSSIDTSSGIRFGIGQGRAGTFPQSVPSGIDPATGARVYPPVGVGSNPAGEGYNIVNAIAGGTTLGAFGRFLGLDLGAALDLAERDGLVTTLSNPNLTALSGETADFLAGGEFPIPISQGLGTTAIEYKKFGVSLAYTPTVLANGRISIRVRPEVSELSSQGAVTLNGYQVPALTIRRAETTVELGSGQSFMIAGLMSNSAQQTIDKAPGVGDVPILGNLFRSRNFRRGETELVIVVTPYLVNPVNERDIRLPTDGFRTSSEGEALLGFRENAGRSGELRPGPRVAGEAGAAPAAPAISAQDAGAPPPPAADARNRNRQAEAAAAPGFNF
ncbi:MAG: secretion system protein [Citromicrobium sp.]|nr:MAG: secretion system protein [Citromicrobium sp.]